jgi:hypothetical protein
LSLVVVLFAVFALAFAGCGGDDETAAQSTPTATETPAATEAPEAEEAEGEDGDSEEEREREEQEAEGASNKDCAEAGDLDGDPKVKPPADLSVPAYAHVYKSEGPFGKTTQYFAAVDGDVEELAEKRDAVVTQLEGAGYKKLATDQEEGTEAEAHLSGPHSVDVQVINLCAGKLRIRYTVG